MRYVATPGTAPDDRPWTTRDTVDCLTALSISALLLTRSINELVFLPDDQKFWLTDFGPAPLAAAISTLLAMALSMTLAVRFARHRAHPLWMVVVRIAFLLTLVPVWEGLHEHLGLVGAFEILLGYQSNPLLFVLTACAVLVASLFCVARWLVPITRTLRIVIVIFFPFALLAIARLSIALVGSPPSAVKSPAVAVARDAPIGRVVWIIFDEFDQRLGFEERLPGLDLPSLDAFRNSAMVATAAHSPGFETKVAIPGMLSGVKFFQATPLSSVDLAVWTEGAKQPSRWMDYPNVFERAAVENFRTRITGYYLPYCRLFAEWVHHCRTWLAKTVHRREDLSYLESAWTQIRTLLPIYPAWRTIDIYDESLADAVEAVRDPNFDLLYLHIAFPHFPFVYDRESEKLTVFNYKATGYFDNLALADVFFGNLRDAMMEARLWESSAVLVTSDHPWKRSVTYDGVRSERVPFMLKLPGQSEPISIERKFNTVIIGDLVLELLSKELREPRHVIDFIEARVSPAAVAPR